MFNKQEIDGIFEEWLGMSGWRALSAEEAVKAFVGECKRHHASPMEQPSEAVAENIDPKGNVVLGRFGDDALLFRGGAYQPFVVAFDYDGETGEWSSGRYLDDLSKAWDAANPEVVDAATIRWMREDFERALEDAGRKPTPEAVAALIEKSGFADSDSMDWYIPQMNETIEDEARAMAENIPMSQWSETRWAEFERYVSSDHDYLCFHTDRQERFTTLEIVEFNPNAEFDAGEIIASAQADVHSDLSEALDYCPSRRSWGVSSDDPEFCDIFERIKGSIEQTVFVGVFEMVEPGKALMVIAAQAPANKPAEKRCAALEDAARPACKAAGAREGAAAPSNDARGERR